MELPNALVGRRDLQSAERRCAGGDEYAVSTGLNVGVGIGDVAVPIGLIPGVDSSLPLVGGVDFGEAEVVPEASFSGCGKLCRGCMSDYLAHRQEYESAAYANSMNAREAAAHQQGASLDASTVAITVLSLLLAAALLLVGWLVWRLWQMRGCRMTAKDRFVPRMFALYDKPGSQPPTAPIDPPPPPGPLPMRPPPPPPQCSSVHGAAEFAGRTPKCYSEHL